MTFYLTFRLNCEFHFVLTDCFFFMLIEILILTVYQYFTSPFFNNRVLVLYFSVNLHS